MQLAFIGAGQMGMPMVQRLLADHRDLTVFARRQEVRDDCEAAGARVAADVATAVSGADAVVLCLYSDPQVLELALGDDGLLAMMDEGSLLVSHTTGSPMTVRELANRGAPRGIRVVDAPVSGSADDIAAGHVTVMLGGEPDDVEQARAIVASYGDPILALGPLGSAQTVKLLNNALFAANVQLTGEIERITAGLGIELAQVAAAIQSSSGASYAMGVVAQIGSATALAEAGGHFLAKDVAVVKEVAAELGVDLGLLTHVAEHGPLTYAARNT
ncbi:MAG: NAD(P)-dependent oxidoreductase [Acidimicrobiia bacterium]|nr:NAD(P)-dependent oxidoreductase [Acidimicrobiia bacterium]